MTRRKKTWDKTEVGARYGAIIALLALIAVTGWQLIQTLSSATADPVASEPERPVSHPASGSPDAMVLARKVVAQHLFGTGVQPTTTASVVKVRTAGAVQLRGVIFAANQDVARAILASGHRQQSYRVGALLRNGDKLAVIRPNRVILMRNGKRYALALRRYGTASEAPSQFPALTRLSGNRAASRLLFTPAVSGDTLQRLKMLRARLVRSVSASQGKTLSR